MVNGNIMRGKKKYFIFIVNGMVPLFSALSPRIFTHSTGSRPGAPAYASCSRARLHASGRLFACRRSLLTGRLPSGCRVSAGCLSLFLKTYVLRDFRCVFARFTVFSCAVSGFTFSFEYLPKTCLLPDLREVIYGRTAFYALG